MPPVVVFAGADGAGYASWPDIALLPNGTLICGFSDGASHTADDTILQCKTSTDHGATWGSLVTIASEAGKRNYSNLGCMNYNPGDGSLLSAYGRVNNGGGAVQASKIKRSTDSGASWSDWSTIAVPSGYAWVWPYGKIRRISSTLYLPCYAHKTADSFSYSLILKSTDAGVNWTLHGNVAGDGVDNFNETDALQTTGNTWLALVRQEESPLSTRYTSSSDGGVTFGALPNFGSSYISPAMYLDSATKIYSAFAVRTGSPELDFWSDDGSGNWATHELSYTTGITDDDFGYPAFVNVVGTLKFVFYNSNHDIVFDTTGISIAPPMFTQQFNLARI